MADDENAVASGDKQPENTSNNGSDLLEPPAKRIKQEPKDDDSTMEVTESEVPAEAQQEPATPVVTPTSDANKTDSGKSSLERDVGISEYVSKHVPGFSGVIKQRYSDFLVNEIDTQGNVIRLTERSVPKRNSGNITFPDATKVLDKETIEKLEELAKNTKDKNAHFTFDVETQSKEARREIHLSVRALFSTLDTTTDVAEGRRVIKVVPKTDTPDNPADFRDKRKHMWSTGQGNNYTHFALHKENVDTVEAINLISQYLRINPMSFTYAGVKEKRAKTVQQISVYRKDALKLLKLNSQLHNMMLGNMTYRDYPLKLGDLSGNRFRIVVRNVEGSEEQIEAAMTSLTERGFINYYDMLRFGTKSLATHHVGLALVRSQWLEAVQLIMKGREGEDTNMAECRRVWAQTRDPGHVLKIMRNQTCIEAHLMRGFAKYKYNKQTLVNAIGVIPKTMRLMYMRRYQSYIWNLIVSRRIEKYGQTVLVGDLLLTEIDREDVDDDAHASRAEAYKKERTQAPKLIPTKVKEGEELTSSIDDVVLPLPGYDVILPENEIAEWYTELLAKDSVTMENFQHEVKDYALPGSYRHVLVHPTNVTWDVTHYTDPFGTLLLSDKEVMNGKIIPGAVETPNQAKKERTTNQEPGTENADETLTPDEPTETADTTLTTEETPTLNESQTPDTPAQKPDESQTTKAPVQTPKATPIPDAAAKRVAVRLQFDLPPSSYATMALREVLRVDMSAAFQSTLNESASSYRAPRQQKPPRPPRPPRPHQPHKPQRGPRIKPWEW